MNNTNTYNDNVIMSDVMDCKNIINNKRKRIPSIVSTQIKKCKKDVPDTKKTTTTRKSTPKKTISNKELIELLETSDSEDDDDDDDYEGDDEKKESECPNINCDPMDYRKGEKEVVSSQIKKIDNIDDSISLGHTYHCKKNKLYHGVDLKILCTLIKPL